MLASVGEKLSDLGKCGKVMSATGKVLGVAGKGLSKYSGYETIQKGNNRGYLDIAMAATGCATSFLVTFSLVSNPVGWGIIIVTTTYGLVTVIYGMSNEN